MASAPFLSRGNTFENDLNAMSQGTYYRCKSPKANYVFSVNSNVCKGLWVIEVHEGYT